MALEDEEYHKAKEYLKKYNNLEIFYPVSINAVNEEILGKHKNASVENIEGIFKVDLPGKIIEQEKTCFLKKTECIYYYSGANEKESTEIKEKLENTLAVINMVAAPKLYTVRNIVILYTPYTNEYFLNEDIKMAINKFK